MGAILILGAKLQSGAKMNTMIYFGFTIVVMTLAALKLDGLEAIAPCVLDFYLLLNNIFYFGLRYPYCRQD